MYKSNIKDDAHFKNEILFLKEYFKTIETQGKLTDGLQYIENYRLDKIYDIVFNHKPIVGDKSKSASIRDIEDSFQDGIEFLKTDVGHRFHEVLHYFANEWKSK